MPFDTNKSIAFIGLGAMGFGMAANLIKQSFAVTGFDLNPSALAKFSALPNARIAKTIPEVCAAAPYVFMMVATPEQVDSVLFASGGLGVLQPNAVLVLFSTLPPTYITSLACRLGKERRGDVRIVDCPVSGGVVGAVGGSLSVMVGSELPTFGELSPALEAISAPGRLMHCGLPSSASTLKMLNQHLAGIHIVSTAEMLSFAACLGVSPHTARSTILAAAPESPAMNWMMGDRGATMLAADWSPRSAIDIFVKDMGIVASAADAVSLPLPIASTALQAFLERAGRGHGRDDDASVVVNYEDAIGKRVGEDTKPSSDEEVNLGLVTSMGKLIHIAAAAECCALAEAIGVNTKIVFELIAGAAGSSSMFKKWFPDMRARTCSLDGNSEATLQVAVAEASELQAAMNKLRFPGRLLTSAHQVFKAVNRATQDKEVSVAATVRFWEQSI